MSAIQDVNMSFILIDVLKKSVFGPGIVAHVCNSSTLGGQVGGSPEGREFEACLTTMLKPCHYKTNKNYPGMVVHNICNPSYSGG